MTGSRGHHDAPGHHGDKRVSPPIAPPETWETGSSSQGGSGRGNPFVQNNDILRMKSSFRFDVPSGRRTGSNLRTFEDKTMDFGIQPSPTTPVPGEIQNLFERLNIASLDSLGAQLDALSTKPDPAAAAPFAPAAPAAPAAPVAPVPSVAQQTGAASLGPTAIKSSGVVEPLAPLPPDVPMVQSAPVPEQKPAKPNTPVLSINQTAKANSASANSTSNTTSTKSVKTKTIKVTTVVKGGTSADVAAAAASQAEIANAVAKGKDLSTSNIAKIAAEATNKVAAKAVANKFPVGSITVKRQANGESIITLSDGQGEPVVLRASGPVKIERIVKPNGKIQFLINPVKPAPLTGTLDPAEADVESEDMSTVASSASKLVSFMTSPLTSPLPLVTKMAKAVMRETLQKGASEITGTENSRANNALVDAALNQAFSSFVSLPLETTTVPSIPSTLLVTPVTGSVSNHDNRILQTDQSQTNIVKTNSLDNVPVDMHNNAFSANSLVPATNSLGEVANSNAVRNDNSRNPSRSRDTNTANRIGGNINQNNNNINTAFTDMQSRFNQNGVLKLFPMAPVPKIPKPPRVIGSIFGSGSGDMSSFFMNDMAVFSDPNIQASLHHLPSMIHGLSTHVTSTMAPAPRQQDYTTASGPPRADIMPKYDLINNAPNIDFASHGLHG